MNNLSTSLPSFCIVLPVYNEASCIESSIRGIINFLSTIAGRTGIIAIDDGSNDGSLDILRRLELIFTNLVVVSHARNLGYGEANRSASKIALQQGFDYAIIMDADGTQDVKYISNFFDPMERGVDFIKATRYAKGGGVEGVPWKRVAISKVGNKLAQCLMGVPLTDFTNGFRAIKSSVWGKLGTTERNFAVLIEEVYLAKRVGVSFSEVPYILVARTEESSQSKFIYSFSVYRNYAKYLVLR